MFALNWTHGSFVSILGADLIRVRIRIMVLLLLMMATFLLDVDSLLYFVLKFLL